MRRKRGAISLKAILLVLGVVCVSVVLLLPEMRSARTPASRGRCANCLKSIGIAVQNYNTEYGVLPPAYTVDEEGNRLHSWRTLLLPYLEPGRDSLDLLYETIDFSKPWNDPANAKARDAVVEVYRCPSVDNDRGLSTYLAVVGPDCVFSGPVSRALSEITDDTRDTLLCIDAPSEQAVHWMSPVDVSEDELLSLGDDSNIQHPGGVNAAFVDGRVRFLYLDFDPDELRAMLTIAGGESVEF